MTEDQVRAQIRQQLIEAGMPAASIDKQLDVVFPAVNSAIDQLMQAIDVLEGPEWLNAQSLGFQLLSERCQSAMSLLLAGTKQHLPDARTFDVKVSAPQ